MAENDGYQLKISEYELWEKMKRLSMSDSDNIAEPSQAYAASDSLMLAMGRAIQKAVLRHKLLGHPIAVGEPDGSVRIIQPEDIEIPDEVYAAYRAEISLKSPK